jgi:hypothetical protein
MRKALTTSQVKARRSATSTPSLHVRDAEAASPLQDEPRSHARRGPALAVLGLAVIVAVELALGGQPAVGDRGYWLGTFPWALVSLMATLTYVAIFVALHLLPTGYNPLRHAVSDYAIGTYGHLFRDGLYLSSVGVLALAVSLTRAIGSPPLAAKDLVYLVMIPLSRVAMALFPTNLEGTPLSAAARVHYASAVAAFTFTYLVISETTPVLLDLTPPPWLGEPLHWASFAVAPALFLVVLTIIGPLRKTFGTAERLFLVTTNAWFLLVAMMVILRSS